MQDILKARFGVVHLQELTGLPKFKPPGDRQPQPNRSGRAGALRPPGVPAPPLSPPSCSMASLPYLPFALESMGSDLSVYLKISQRRLTSGLRVSIGAPQLPAGAFAKCEMQVAIASNLRAEVLAAKIPHHGAASPVNFIGQRVQADSHAQEFADVEQYRPRSSGRPLAIGACRSSTPSL